VDVPEQVVALRAMGCTHGQGMAFSGPLDEYRLRRSLTRAEYPVPGGAAEHALAGSGAPALRGSTVDSRSAAQGPTRGAATVSGTGAGMGAGTRSGMGRTGVASGVCNASPDPPKC
jgi:hypothetical protein